ncbi:hypothetical protein FH972_023440 [Carpinus fangiana]|uniref:DNA repair protein RAD16 n=1 Tax=Carpinus fangiana TaxID=176857 RepID=A0A5N6KVT4_9ROSI|nr:hypothetical protein FH972_023440 [Carpinus fangiana]
MPRSRQLAAGALPPPPPAPRRRSTRSSLLTPNDITHEAPHPSFTTRRELKAVVVPVMEDRTFKKPLPMRKLSVGNSSTDSASSTREASADYDTPATSATNTPAASLRGGIKQSVGKRKRGSPLKQEDTSALNDESLAAALQEEEYAQESEEDRPQKTFKVDETSDDDDDDGDVFDIEQDTDEDDAPLSRRKGKGKAPLKPLPKARATPKRKARLAAETAKATNKSFVVGSDESDLSEVDLSEIEAKIEEDDSDEVEFDEPITGTDTSDADADEDLPQRSSGRQTFSNWRDRRRFLSGMSTRSARERYKLEQAHPEITTMWDELKAVPLIEAKQAKQPSDINRTLKTFQLEGLNWMTKQEQTKWKGGLLGDEMGMGKTIQAVSLIMSDYPQKEPTLVVVPPVALMQWTNEIAEYTDGKLKVLVYHGSNAKAKKMKVKELKSYDVIMISYSGLESVHRKETKGWTREDSIIKEDSAIHSIHFHRLILDEAHSIKQRNTGVAKACFALKGTYKWCLSGTPVQNRIGEFFSLLRFLEVSPFANYFCKSCDCSQIHYDMSSTRRCNKCNHRALDHVSVFNQEILNPITSEGTNQTRKDAFAKLRLLTDHIMLRRMKRDHTASMELPPKEIIIHNEFFGPVESDFASSIMNNTARKFDTYVSQGVMLNNYANIFGLIMQMRQVADHPDMILRKHAAEGQNVMVCNICDEPAEDAIKSRCRHEFCRSCVKDFVKSSDSEVDCPRCHIALAIDLEQPEIEQDEENVKKSSIINRIKMENWTSSTKIEMLVYDLWKLRSKKQTTKSIVFSQFTSMLQLIEWRLRRAGFNTVMLDGSMSPQQRQKSIEYFMTNTNVEVFLVSLKAGGVALNLTEASRVFIVDPWWNPAAEWQSADRCHRIGQRRPCVITRLCVEDSIESRIVMLQEKKAHMINSTVNKDDVAMDKLTPQDMHFLFRGS